MPRIRTVKPEFCTSEQVAECSTNARLLFVLMWCFCDDAGRHPANSKRLKMEVFPGDSFTDHDIKTMVSELIRAGLLVEYKHENVVFWQVTGWKHQRIDRPSFKYPPSDPEGRPLPIESHSTIIRRAFDEHSPPECKGMEGSGVEGSGKDDCGVGEVSPTPPKIADPSGFTFVVSDGSEWSLSLAKFNEYRKTFPELDLDREFRLAAQWLRDNAKKRKTPKGMPAFLGSWLGRSQNRGGADRGGSVASPKTFGQAKVENTLAAAERFVSGRTQRLPGV